eukprot:CAMPEP_0115457904 /NCGR_PEP_ID=MMETSP0271-20121206/45457_1 /TAXON_ID=71861 /ORGANISM="Scrippsiella trochoidea, Strain CCMP3099" /LENGTH=183 /DNA_ID=CAMNT_0002884491 /DNA_START=197 /DNA_END=748 /DNA_ORIENTATION=+
MKFQRAGEHRVRIDCTDAEGTSGCETSSFSLVQTSASPLPITTSTVNLGSTCLLRSRIAMPTIRFKLCKIGLLGRRVVAEAEFPVVTQWEHKVLQELPLTNRFGNVIGHISVAVQVVVAHRQDLATGLALPEVKPSGDGYLTSDFAPLLSCDVGSIRSISTDCSSTSNSIPSVKLSLSASIRH